VPPPKFWTGIIKLGLVLTTVQNFTLVGPRISEILRLKNIWGKTIVFGWTNNAIVYKLLD